MNASTQPASVIKAEEPISDQAAFHALHRGEFDMVVRYLREIAAPAIRNRYRGQICATATIHGIADMLQGRANLDWHLVRKWSRRGRPFDAADTLMKNIRIGWRVAVHPESGYRASTVEGDDPDSTQRENLKNAVVDVCTELGIKQAHAYKCFDLFQKYNRHNERDEPMPIPGRRRTEKRSVKQ